jgi:Kef-type K+ transport system membrane component KefB
MLILQIVVIVGLCRFMGMLFRLIRQPRVVGEMFAGIMLGPSLLGRLFPGVSDFIFPASGLGYLNVLSQIGLLIFMFLVGLEMNTKELKCQKSTVFFISNAGIAVPFVLGCCLARYLYPRLSDESVSFVSFALFMGAAMSITAFPVLARILMERGIVHTRLGTVALACAAVDDISGWCMLALIMTAVHTVHAPGSIWAAIGGILTFVLLMVFVVRRLLRRLSVIYHRDGALGDDAFSLILLLVFISALCTEWLGLHLLFGAFLLGAIMPKEQKFVRHIVSRLEVPVVSLLLPLFFAYTGLRTRIEPLKGNHGMWGYFVLILLVAIVGKLGGSALSARMLGMPSREAIGLGILMNTRGLMELVVLNIGLDIKVISPNVFSMMVIMALLTTFMTVPVLEMVFPKHLLNARQLGYTGQNIASDRRGDVPI